MFRLDRACGAERTPCLVAFGKNGRRALIRRSAAVGGCACLVSPYDPVPTTVVLFIADIQPPHSATQVDW